MTRDEFMEHARKEIDLAFSSPKNRVMNLVEKAWKEGKRNAEIDGVMGVLNEAIERHMKGTEKPAEKPDDEVIFKCPCCGTENHIYEWSAEQDGYFTTCRHCGKAMCLRVECQSANDNLDGICDWVETEDGGRCFRGGIFGEEDEDDE